MNIAQLRRVFFGTVAEQGQISGYLGEKNRTVSPENRQPFGLRSGGGIVHCAEK